MSTLAGRALIGVSAAYLLICAAYYVGQDALIFIGRPATAVSTHIQFQSVAVDVGDAQLRGVLVNPDRVAPTLFYLGGNAESATGYAARFAALPVRTYLIDYRGYGDSNGRPSQSSLVSDAKFLVRQLTGATEDVFLIGRSLGAGVAALAAADLGPRVTGLVLLSPFCSFGNVVALHAPAFLPSRFLLAHPFDVESIAPRLPQRLTLVIGLADRVIPPAESQCLVASTHPDTELIQISGAGHNELIDQPAVWQAIERMITPSVTDAPPRRVLL